MGLAGEVSNHTGGVSILVQGPEAEVEAFIRELQQSSHYMQPDMVGKGRAWAENFCRLLSPLL